MARIWRFPLQIEQRQLVHVPAGAVFLDVSVGEDSQPCVYALIDPDAQAEPSVVTVVTTGEEFDPDGMTYLGTFKIDWYVGHVWLGAGYHSKSKEPDMVQVRAERRVEQWDRLLHPPLPVSLDDDAVIA